MHADDVPTPVIGIPRAVHRAADRWRGPDRANAAPPASWAAQGPQTARYADPTNPSSGHLTSAGTVGPSGGGPDADAPGATAPRNTGATRSDERSRERPRGSGGRRQRRRPFGSQPRSRDHPAVGRAVLPCAHRPAGTVGGLRRRRGPGGVSRRADSAAGLPRPGPPVPRVRLRHRRPQGGRRPPFGRPQPLRAVEELPEELDPRDGPEQRHSTERCPSRWVNCSTRFPPNRGKSSCCVSSLDCRRRRQRKRSNPLPELCGWHSTGPCRSCGPRCPRSRKR